MVADVVWLPPRNQLIRLRTFTWPTYVITTPTCNYQQAMMHPCLICTGCLAKRRMGI